MKTIARVTSSILIAFSAIAFAPVLVAAAIVDTDGDTVPDDIDNCISVPNTNQLDTDGDGYGNFCDGDLNNSNLTTATDFNLLRGCLNLPSTTSALCAAADMNGSGLVTASDFNLLRARLNTAPGPSGPVAACAANPVAAENCKTAADGVVDRSVWDVPGYQGASASLGYPLPLPGIEGFSTQFSVAPGETVAFKVNNARAGAPALPFTTEILRLGWYRGAGARRVAQLPSVSTPQPACASQCTTSMPACLSEELFRDCANWATSVQWTVPLGAVSGVYLAKFSKSPSDAVHVPFVVREAPGAAKADVLFQLDDQTWQAYNDGGSEYGDSLYALAQRGVSYNRPFRNRYPIDATHFQSEHFLFEIGLPLIAFLERNGFSVSYAGSPDLDAHPELLAGRKAYLAGGHDEYWTGERRNAVEAAVAAGTHLLFLGEGHSFSKTRWQAVAGLEPRRVVVGYKTILGVDSSPTDPRRNEDDWSGVWRDTRTDQVWTRPATQPARPESALVGTATGAAAQDGANLTVPPSMVGQRFWRDTCAAVPGCNLGDRNVGSEYDIRADRYYEVHTPQQPPGLFSVSATLMTRPFQLPLTDPNCCGRLLWGVKPQEDVADLSLPGLTSEATLHRRASGALVFSAATMRWSWGLDAARNDGNTGTSSRAIQQAMINLLADMGIQPAFLHKDPTNVADPELVRASASTDTTPPTSHIAELDPAAGLVTGTAADVGGVVAGVEVSFDAGTTWHGANLAQSAASTAWSYASVVPANVGALVRAVDDSGNLELGHGSDTPIAPSSGLATYTIAGSPAWQQTIVNSFTASPGWTSLVPLNLDNDNRSDILSYNAVSGRAVFSYAITGPPCPVGVWCGQQVASDLAASPGWTLVVPMTLNGDGFTDLLSYNAATGLSYYSLAATGAPCPSGVWCNIQVLPLVPPQAWPNFPGLPEASVGWTSIVPMDMDLDGRTDLVWYAAATGLAEYTVADPSGCASSVYCKQKIVSVANAALGWTAVVPLDLNGDGRTDLLSYNAATGRADYSIASGTNCDPGVFCGQAIVAETFVAPGFTSIVPVNLNNDGRTDLLMYNKATGQAVYSVATSSGCAPGIYCGQTVVDIQSAAPGWNLVVALRLNSDFLTDLLWYH